MSDLPNGWAETTLGEICEGKVDQAGPDPTQNSFCYVDISSIDRATKKIVSPQQLPVQEAPSRARQKLQPDDVLVSMTRPNLNAVAMVQEDLEGSIGSTGFHVLRMRQASPLWVSYRVQASDFVAAMSMKVQGALYPAVRPNDIAQFATRLPPREEQDRIVAEIEKQFTRLDAATAALKRVQANLKRYRASVLKAACEGRLVRREQNPTSYATVPVAELLREPLANGRSPKATEQGCKILRLTAIKNGQVDPGEFRMGIVTEALIGNISIRHNDILISRGNGSKSLVGLAGLVAARQAETEPVLFPDTMIRARLKNELCDPRFFVLIWNSRFVRDQIERTARTTAGIHKISQTDIERFRIPLPSVEEQAVIVTIAEQAISNVQHTDEALTRLVARSANLRASVLSDAFSGRLTPQNLSDEPAAALLERIRAERTEPTAQTNRRIRRPTAELLEVV